MKWILIFLYFIGLIGHKTREVCGDPAPGRSPGPPLSNLYSAEASHETYRAEFSATATSSNSNSNNNSNNQNRFSDIFSSISREYHESSSSSIDDNDNQPHDDDILNNGGGILPKSLINKPKNENEKIARLQNDDEIALKALKNFSSTLQTSTRLALSSKLMNGSENSINESQESMKNSRNRCYSGVSSGKVFNYIRIGEKVVNMNARNDGLQIDVTHDVFSTTTSLLTGIIYKGKKF